MHSTRSDWSFAVFQLRVSNLYSRCHVIRQLLHCSMMMWYKTNANNTNEEWSLLMRQMRPINKFASILIIRPFAIFLHFMTRTIGNLERGILVLIKALWFALWIITAGIRWSFKTKQDPYERADGHDAIQVEGNLLRYRGPDLRSWNNPS